MKEQKKIAVEKSKKYVTDESLKKEPKVSSSC